MSKQFKFLAVAALLVASASHAKTRSAAIYLTKAFESKDYQIRKAAASVTETLFQNREKYGVSGTAKFEVNKGRGRSEKFTCRYGKSELPVDGPKIGMPPCKLNKKVVFGDYNFEELFAESQIVKMEERKPNDKDPFCTRHVVRTIYSIVPENLAQKAVQFGTSEIVVYASDGCVNIPDYDFYKYSQRVVKQEG